MDRCWQRRTLAACCALVAQSTQAQATGFLSRVNLRASVFDKNAIEKPALLQATWPDGARTYYSIDAGLTLDVISPRSSAAARWKVGPYVEYHRKTQLKQEQDSFLAGVSVLNIAGDPGASSHYTQLKGEYKRDRVKGTESAQGSLLYMPLLPRYAIGLARGPDSLRVIWQPTVGLEAERVASAAAGKPTGSVARLSAGIDLAFYPADGRWQKRLELAFSWMYWRDAAERGGFDDGRDSHRQWKSTLSYALDAAARVSVGLELVDGENPSKGQADQRYAQFALRLKY